MKLVIKLAKASRRLTSSDFYDPTFKKLIYVRYADDWIIGIKGSLIDTREILTRIDLKIESMGLKLSPAKTKITNISKSKVLFLGTEIYRARAVTYSRPSHNFILRKNSLKLRLDAPISKLISKLHDSDFLINNKPSPKFIWLSLEHRQIIYQYNAVFRGLLNYYHFSHNYRKLVSRLNFVLKMSCAKLLAAKYSLGTAAKVFQKYGPQLSCIPEKGKTKIYKFIKPDWTTTLKFLTNSTPIITLLYGSKSLAKLDDLVCSKCGSRYRVEMHHIRHLKDLNPKLSSIDRMMAVRARKQIPLCRECHMFKHRLNRSTIK